MSANGIDTTASSSRAHQPAPVTYLVEHTTQYAYSEPVAVCHNEIHLVPRGLAHQRVLTNSVTVSPQPASLSTHVDAFGNTVGYFSLQEPHDQLTVASSSRVEVLPPIAWQHIPARNWELLRDEIDRSQTPEAMYAKQFCFESPLVRTLEPLAAWAADLFPPGRPWVEAAIDLTRRIYQDFVYDPLATTISTPVEEVFRLRRGVCQDFAHLQIACLRSLGLAARYVSGYIANTRSPGERELVGADASHAWLSVWGGESGWLDLDPTNDCVPASQHVTLGWGRDYADVCPIKGVYVGGGNHRMDVAVHVTPLSR
jgi:transglutaminase-like putative cysteine protease